MLTWVFTAHICDKRHTWKYCEPAHSNLIIFVGEEKKIEYDKQEKKKNVFQKNIASHDHMSTSWNCLDEAIPCSTHMNCFHAIIVKTSLKKAFIWIFDYDKLTDGLIFTAR